MRAIRFIHAADLHIGAPFAALKTADTGMQDEVLKSTETAVERMVRAAVRESVDFLLLAGDLFDQKSRSIRGQVFLKQQFERLEKEKIKVYIIYGNHDPVEGNYAPVTWPDNVHVFSNKGEWAVHRVDEKQAVHIYGYSYEKREVTENIVPFYEKQPGGMLHIALLHGQQLESTAPHQPYAPFRLQELKDKQMDYWALGHIHKRMELAPNIHYPGCIQGHHLKEDGEKGCLLVELSPEQTTTKFMPVSPFTYERITVSINQMTSIEELHTALEETLETRFTGSIKGCAVRLIIEGSGPLHDVLRQEAKREEMLEWLGEAGRKSVPFYIVESIENKTMQQSDIDAFEQLLFTGDLKKAAQTVKSGEANLKDNWPSLKNSAERYGIEEPAAEELVEEALHLIREKWLRREADDH
ncbi:DNA repair exonuclease SbcCD nuclease subunit [Sinobaca qinghaiensis]|uniref:DNA repair exonuclease SbcCD nuclease subunit n=2 Tax=Sinobaca qinghaiensis TaxID=342944 RepID=A0A419V3Z4_9BACL|nr:DNA repair exonuclease SbcCD nuclease subunit [Sinobaca qinghaiensis]